MAAGTQQQSGLSGTLEPWQNQYIPCPVCGGEMSVRDWPFLQGEGTGRFIDCELRHRSLTPPNIYEPLRLERVREDIADYISRNGILPL